MVCVREAIVQSYWGIGLRSTKFQRPCIQKIFLPATVDQCSHRTWLRLSYYMSEQSLCCPRYIHFKLPSGLQSLSLKPCMGMLYYPNLPCCLFRFNKLQTSWSLSSHLFKTETVILKWWEAMNFYWSYVNCKEDSTHLKKSRHSYRAISWNWLAQFK